MGCGINLNEHNGITDMRKAHVLAVAVCLALALKLQAQTPGTVKWSFPLTNATTASPALGVDGTAYIADGISVTSPWRLWAVNSNGIAKWHYDLGGGAAGSPAIATNGTVYVFDTSTSPEIWAFNPDGSTNWAFQDTYYYGSGKGHPAVAPDGRIYFAYANNVAAFSRDGSNQWFYTDASQDYLFDYASPAIALDGTIIVNGNDGRLYALYWDGSGNFTNKWVFATPEAGTISSMLVSPPAIGSDGTIYCGVEKGVTSAYFLALRPGTTNATLKWAYTNSTMEAFGSGAAIGSDGTIYVQSTVDGTQGYLCAFTPNGSNKWMYPVPAGLPANVISTPAVAADGTVYVGGGDGKLYAIGSNGSLLWATTILATSVQSSPVIGQDGTVYVAGNGTPAALYAVYGSAPPAVSFWPEYGKNSRRSGSTSPLTIKSRGLNASKQFQLAITGTTGIVCTVGGSTDLVTWTNAGTVSLTAATNIFADPRTTNFSRRFYRTAEQ